MSRVVVFDTNILFSANGWRGKPYECLDLARRGIIESVTCAELLDELTSKLQSKLLFSPDQALATVLDLLTFSRIVSIPGQLRAVAVDPQDDKVLECAVVAGATHIVTGDRRHLLPMKNYQGIQIVTASELISLSASS